MVGRLFKIAGLVGGGILALGTGAFGTHLSQPYLEPLLNPERKEREDRLQESFKDAEEQVEALTRNLGELQKTSITNLEGEVKGLNEQIDATNAEINNKNQELISKNAQIQEQENLNSKQSVQIVALQGQLTQKTKDLSDETEKKNKVKGELDSINQRLALTRDDILTPKAIKETSLKVDIRKVTWKKADSGIATFEVVDYKNATKTITIKSDGLTNHEAKAKEIRSKGITFQLDDSFSKWEKVFKLERYDIDYDYVAPKGAQKDAFIKNDKTTKEEIKLTDYFNSGYYEEAFKVFIAIVFLDMFPMCHNLEDSSPNRPYVFCDNKSVTQEFLGEGKQTWKEFTKENEDDRKFKSFLYSFVTINDFISYWTKKTVEFVRTGTVDLFDFLNPIVISKNYTSGN